MDTKKYSNNKAEKWRIVSFCMQQNNLLMIRLYEYLLSWRFTDLLSCCRTVVRNYIYPCLHIQSANGLSIHSDVVAYRCVLNFRMTYQGN